MKYTIIRKTEEYYDPLAGEIIPAKTTYFDLPYDFNQEVWYVCVARRKYKVVHDRIRGCWCTDDFSGYRLHYTNWCVDQTKFDRLFDNKNDAIDFCLKANERAKVKVKDYE